MKTEKLLSITCDLWDVYRKVQDIQADCKDYRVANASTNVKMEPNGALSFLGESMELSSWALSQLGIKVGVPGSYLEKCMDNGLSGLAATNVNTWMERKKNNTLFIRTRLNTVRGILSNRYTPCDADSIVEMILDNIDTRYWLVKGYYIDEERMHFRLAGQDEIDVDGEKFFPVLFVDSSDVGRCALSIRFGLYQASCRNGIILPRVKMYYHQRHIGINETEFILGVKKTLDNMDEMILQAERYIRKAKADVLELHDASAVGHLTNELRVKAKMTEKDARKTLDFMSERYEATRLGLASALADLAQEMSLERRLELENAAGRILSGG